jgi:RHS repeat-associated protein
MRRLLLTVVLLGLAAVAQAQEVVEYYHTDALGSVRAVTDQSGAVVARHDYLPFGEEYLPQAGNDPRRFTGKERDAETGLDYFEARYYRAGIGRFTTVDPGHVNGNIFDPQSWNAYAFARNNPLRFTDPTGTEYRICPNGGTCQSVSDQYFGYVEGHPGSGISLRNGVIFATVNGNQVVAGSYEQTSVDPTFNNFIRGTGQLADRWLKQSLTQMAVGTAMGAGGGLLQGALSGGLAFQEVLGIGRIAGSTLEATFGAGRAAVVRQVIAGRQPVSVLTAEERALAAAYYRSVAGRTGGTYAAEAARYNIARAELLEGARTSLSRTLPEFIKNAFR